VIVIGRLFCLPVLHITTVPRMSLPGNNQPWAGFGTMTAACGEASM